MIDCADVAAGQALLPHVLGPRTSGGMVGAGRPSGVALRHLRRCRRRMSLDPGDGGTA